MPTFKDLFSQVQKSSHDKLDANYQFDIQIQGQAQVDGSINDYCKTGTLYDVFTLWNNAVVQPNENE